MHVRFATIWILCYFLIGVQNTYAQFEAKLAEGPFETFNNRQGLSQAFVPSILQDKKGFMWFATNDGLNRFDGYHVKVYRQDRTDAYSLPDNAISCVAEDKLGRLWVATVSKGVFLFNPELERFYHIPFDVIDANGSGILKFEKNKLLTCNANGCSIYDLSNMYETKKWNVDSNAIRKEFLFNVSDSNTTATFGKGWFAISFMPDLSFWIAKKDSLIIFRPNASATSWTHEYMSAKQVGMQDQELFHFSNLGEGDTVAFVGLKSLSLYSIKQQRIIFQKPFLKGCITKEIFFPNCPAFLGDGHILFCTYLGYYLLNAKTLELKRLNTNNGIGQFSGISHFLDKDGILWIGSSGRGVFKFNLKNTLFHTIAEDCYGILENSLHQIYIRFRSGPKAVDTESKNRTPFVPKNLWNPDWFGEDLFCANPHGDVWIRAASHKLKAVDGKSNKLLLLKYNPLKQTISDYSQLYDSTIYKNYEHLKLIFTGKNNDLWQLNEYDQEPYYRIKICDGITYQPKAILALPRTKTINNTIFRFHDHFEDVDGNLWLGTNAGLLKLEPKSQKWTVYKSSNDTSGLSGDQILSITDDPIDPHNYLWVGTDGQGLNKFNLKTGQCIHYRQEQGLPNNVICAIQHDEYGNLWMSTNQGLSCYNLKSKTFRNYNTDNGLPGNEFNTKQFLKAQNGLLYFAGIDGIVWFNPKEILDAQLPENNIVFTNFSIFNKEVNFKNDTSILHQSIDHAKVIILPFDQNMFSIEFALLQYCKPEKKQYQYWLEGFNKTWIDNGSNNIAMFTNLDPGHYIFHVRAANSDGVWTSTNKSIEIIIKSPWYATWWFRSLLFLLIGGSLYAFYRYRLQQSLRVVSMRNIIASDLHDEIGSTISSIIVYSDIIKSEEKNKDLQQIAERINNSSRNILVVMSDIVWSINPKNDRFDNVILRMRTFAHEVLDAQNKTLHFEADEKLQELKLEMNDRKNFYLIFKEALNNIIKYADANQVWISMQLDNDLFTFIITDDGKGFDLEEYKEGNGILNMQKRAQDLKGEFRIETQIKKGTTIQVTFPI